MKLINNKNIDKESEKWPPEEIYGAKTCLLYINKRERAEKYKINTSHKISKERKKTYDWYYYIFMISLFWLFDLLLLDSYFYFRSGEK